MNSWDKELLRRSRYQAVFESLLKRASKTPHLFRSAPVYPEFSLMWTLRNQDLVINLLLKSIQDPSYELSPQNLIKIKTDKVRDIYQAHWPERILLMVMGEILKEKTDSLVGPHVYSFRKGRGPWTALNALANFVQKARKKNPGAPILLLKRDIKKYGDTIPQSLLFERLLSDTSLPSESRYFALLRQGVSITYAPRETPEIQTCLRLGIPSGSPLVPPLENFYLTPLDAALSSIPEIYYGRYGDDFVCASADERPIEMARARIEECVAALGLRTKIEKEMDLSLGPQQQSGVTWLGARVTFKGILGMKPEHLRVARRHLRGRIKSIVVRIGKFELEDSVRTKVLSRAIQSLLDTKTQPVPKRLVNDQNNIELLKDIDRDIYKWIVADISQFWRIRKRPAWRIVRRLRIPSLAYAKAPRKVA
jgi:hypothetical protein